AQPINAELTPWDVRINLSVNQITPDVITKSLISYTFSDQRLGDTSFELDRFGQGFQRSVIYELIRLASSFQKETKPGIDEFDPDFTLLLFEEPEAFLHPAQQENMAYHLRELGKKPGWQVIITSHSPVFVSKNSDNLGQICRIQKCDTVSRIYQLNKAQEDQLIKAGGDFLNALKQFVEDSTIPPQDKKKALDIIKNAPSDDIAEQYEKFRHQLWLDADRSAMFFADKVLLVEGATEKMLFNYLLANQWHDLNKERILIVEALGKYNFHRFISLFEAYGIRHGIMLDNDNNKNIHAAINQLIRNRKTEFTLGDPVEFNKDLETHLGISLPKRNDQKPLNILQKLESNAIAPEKLAQLRKDFCKALAIHTNKAP
ncbi:MAG: AAA family ATPase, partial [Proteobacteria bacterium]|nr:AAA family ATPase [Pseudomonadota bacterium]